MAKNQSEYLIKRNNNEYEVVIGLEVHAQVLSESKLFSSVCVLISDVWNQTLQASSK